MVPSRLLVAPLLFSLAAACFAACFSGPTIGAHKTTATSTSSAGKGGSGAGAGAGAGGTGSGFGASGVGPSGTGATGAGAGGTGGTSTGGSGAGAGPGDGGFMDVSADALGKGGLPLGAMCGASTTMTDAGTDMCGEGLACCYPCKHMMCDTFCVLACNPKNDPMCIGGCVLMP